MKVITAIIVCLLTASCQTHWDLLPTSEVVLTEGMVLTGTNPNGTVTISAGKGTERTFKGDDWSKRRELIPRTTRWYGSLGLYDPADSFTPHGRLLVDEGRLFFDSESEALRYLAGCKNFKPVFNNHGLVFGYHVENIPGGEPTRSVQVWQIYIRGQRPESLRGAQDLAVTVKGGTIPDTAKPNPAPIGYEKTLGEKEYSPE